VGEISTGTRGGVGRLVIEYSRQATTDPAKVFVAMLGAAALGLVVAGAVSLLERLATHHHTRTIGAEATL
jgi:NitT/TauT family transport system permease protein